MRRQLAGPADGPPRWAVPAGAAIAALTVVLYAGLVTASIVLGATDPDEESVLGGSLWLLSWVPFGLVGGLLVARRPRNPIGWYLAGIALPLLVVIAIDNVTVAVLQRDPTAAWLPWGAWVAGWLYAPTIPLLGLLVAAFPTGRVRTRLLARLVPVVWSALVAIGVLRALRPGPSDTHGIVSPVAGPLDRATTDTLITVVTAVAVLFGAVAAVDLVLRWVRSRGVERRQVTWFATSVGLFVVLFVVLVALEAWLGEVLSPVAAEAIGSLVFLAGLGGMATSIGVAVLRYRLYDLDRLVSRAVSYTLVTALLAVAYATLVLGAQALLGGDEVPDVVVAGSTLAVAGAARPAVRRVRHVVDRRFNRAAYDGERVVAAFGALVRDRTSLDDVAGELVATARASLAPAHASVWTPTARAR